jgi:tetratricopeptide (TPR) repeat protein
VAFASSLVAAVAGISAFVVHRNRELAGPPANPEVELALAEGNHCLTSELPERRRQGIKFFEEALRIEPTNVPALQGVFNACHMFSPEARAAASKLQEIAPNSAEAHHAHACVLWWDWNFADALVEARTALKMPAASKADLGWAYVLVGWFLVQTGHPDEALIQYRMAERLLPANPIIESHLGHPYTAQCKFDEAIAHYTNSLNLEPSYLLSHRAMAEIYEYNGDLLKAIDEQELGDVTASEPKVKSDYAQLRTAFRTGGSDGYYRKCLEQLLSDPSPDLYWVAETFAAQGNTDLAYIYLEKAVETHSNEIAGTFGGSLFWDHADPRFQAIARQVGLMR